MKRKTYTETQIVAILRAADSGKSTEEVCREYNIAKASLYRWRKKYGNMELRDVKRLKQLERENEELKKIVADQLLNIKVLEHVNAKKW